MKIIILGAGQVGATLAEHLANENNDITVIDKDPDKLLILQERLDLRTIPGNASYPNLLRRAGAEDADLLIAVTSSDETNMIACQIAYTLFKTPTKIARVRALQYLAYDKIFDDNALPVDVLISPEQLVTNHIRRLIENPDALQVLDFADRRVQLVAMRASEGGPLVGHQLKKIREHMPNIDTRVVAIFRQGKLVQPRGSTVIMPDDEVFFIASRDHIRAVMGELRNLDVPNKRVLIAGGGHIGTRLAIGLEQNYRVKVIEHRIKSVERLAAQLSSGIVLHGDAADRELLLNENIENTDVFCAVTNSDEANIMSALLAKRLGARKVMALINRPAYVDVIEGSEIDIAISPQQTTISSLLTHVRRGDVVNVHSLRRGAAEALEAIVHGDKQSSRVVGRCIEDIPLPKGAIIGAIVRDNEVTMGHHNEVIHADDHLILFLSDKRKVPEVEKLFQSEMTYF